MVFCSMHGSGVPKNPTTSEGPSASPRVNQSMDFLQNLDMLRKPSSSWGQAGSEMQFPEESQRPSSRGKGKNSGKKKGGKSPEVVPPRSKGSSSQGRRSKLERSTVTAYDPRTAEHSAVLALPAQNALVPKQNDKVAVEEVPKRRRSRRSSSKGTSSNSGKSSAPTYDRRMAEHSVVLALPVKQAPAPKRKSKVAIEQVDKPQSSRASSQGTSSNAGKATIPAYGGCVAEHQVLDVPAQQAPAPQTNDEAAMEQVPQGGGNVVGTDRNSDLHMVALADNEEEISKFISSLELEKNGENEPTG